MPFEIDALKITTVYGLGAVALIIAVYYALQVNRLYGRIVSLQETLNVHLKECGETNRQAKEDRKDLHARIDRVGEKMHSVSEDVSFLRGRYEQGDKA